ncbi:hypothetical protein NP493_4709g00008 [Ridgeia piscesae]|uniref:MULE transposase domain-containing protein n=1 Tax=Ridgeia piscesae TaxID=27915 RepID=A0AAD9MTZ0_RIDPI|nr:hypothetical protein NP493_4709g00008 [Ridgeia piscesae]
MTDDCEAEGAAIRQVWSSANRLLCTFHLGQAAWRWLRQTSSGVAEGKRQQRMKEFRSLVFSSTRESLDRRYCDLKDLEQKFVEYLRKLMLRKEEWAHCFRTVGHHTNNIVEAPSGY